MSRPHFRMDAKASALYESQASRSIEISVRAAIHGGWSVRKEDVPTPHTDAMAALPLEQRSGYLLANAKELAAERNALRLVAVQDGIHRGLASAAEDRRREERAAFVSERMNQLRAEFYDELEKKWRAQAEKEAAAAFGDTTTQPENEPPPRKTRRAA